MKPATLKLQKSEAPRLNCSTPFYDDLGLKIIYTLISKYTGQGIYVKRIVCLRNERILTVY